jgi:hypothetical protein
MLCSLKRWTKQIHNWIWLNYNICAIWVNIHLFFLLSCFSDVIDVHFRYYYVSLLYSQYYLPECTRYQCCGSVMLIPEFSISDPTFSHPGSRIRTKEFKYFNPKNCHSTLGNMIQIVHPESRSWFLPIPDPGSRGLKGTGSRIRNTAWYLNIKILHQCMRYA